LQVAQVNASQWAISARGFNNVLANKLLVLIDGRTVYTPMYAGVFWDVQNLLLEDVDHIEVISGPGGTLWGANAVNGVINIITKNTRDTKGLYAEAAAGSGLPGLGSLRYGGQLTKKLSYRVFGTGFKMGSSTTSKNDSSAEDHWSMVNGGFRLDWEVSKNDNLSLQANMYKGKPKPDGGDTAVPIVANGEDIVARWEHTNSAKAGFQLQAYYDHTWRNFGSGFTEDLKTYDIDFHQRYQFSKRNTLTAGLNLRLMDHTVTNLPLFAFQPGQKTLYLYSAFVQDEMMLVKERLRITAGIKVEHNSYTGFEYQPDVRLTWTPAENQTIWTAVSRAVRTPARIDRDFFLYIVQDLPLIGGSKSFVSEDLIAYELGWRWQPLKNLSTSLAGFYNVYDNIRSAEPGPLPFNIPITFANGVKGQTYGIELSATCQLTDWWKLRGGYTFLKKDLSVKPDSKDLNGGTAESDDPEHQFLIQSTVDIPGRIELGTVVRHIGKLPKPVVPAYTGLDIRVGWKLNNIIELNIIGQNLLDKHHPEFIPSSPAPREINRCIYGKIVCRL
ncbi:MAG TPA: TonB-dependent receptor, partial [Chitinophagaceae bacterium]|nr:TonB-dependent receptor [Chitinophagaceae bacterium]